MKEVGVDECFLSFQVIAFLDDLHMPGSDVFGTQQCSEFLRQLLNNGGWYDRRNLTWKVQHPYIHVTHV